MPTKELVCLNCDCHFTVKTQRGFDVNFCPHCGGEICSDDGNDYSDDE